MVQDISGYVKKRPVPHISPLWSLCKCFADDNAAMIEVTQPDLILDYASVFLSMGNALSDTNNRAIWPTCR